MKKKVLLFARSFLSEYYSGIKSDILDPIFVTLTHKEKVSLEGKGWKVYGCFEDEYNNLPVAQYNGDYLKTSFLSDRFLNRYSYEKRLEILGKEISFWSAIMDFTSPDFLVNETVAVEIAEVMAIEAKKRSIPFYTSLLGFIPGTFYWKPDPFTGSLSDLASVNPSTEDITQAHEYIIRIVEKNERPFYVANTNQKNVPLLTFVKTAVSDFIRYFKESKRLKADSFIYEDYRSFYFSKQKEFLRKLFWKYDSLETLGGRKYLFYPMHVEPEAILSYFVYENYSQTEVIENIIKSLKVGQYLVVKEHPQHPGILLSKTYRLLKEKYKNLIYLPSYELSFPVIKSTDAIVTLTSTVGWEALIMGKPVFLLGNIFYDQCDGVVKLSSFRELKKALHEKEYVLPQKENVELYAAKMISLFKVGCPSPIAKEQGLASYVLEMEKLNER